MPTADDRNRMFLSQDEYLRVAGQLNTLLHAAEGLDFRALIRTIERSLSAGPVLDPTLYRRGAQQAELTRELAIAAQRFVDEVAVKLPQLKVALAAMTADRFRI